MPKRLSTLKDLQTSETLTETEEPLSITGVETFSVNYKVNKYPPFLSSLAVHPVLTRGGKMGEATVW